ncbi:hypothetical protein F4553_007347 [Allocatelliglobosispora scoriae]|uniref:Fibronectin type-III domain-containing protein n=1 Tax=Allocatelliglobosispora scoriae TaxID=643052 RepID=A0A841C447_9ACTN|nr:fibronectin type III domain-containing protein [Allocatelliglobosispora scoriae]MBB5873913.1 hypothetical protein [Allocatelliglobosispora scoriae]
MRSTPLFRRGRGGLRRALAMLCGALLVTPLVVVLTGAQTPALAAVRRDVQGIQAGWVLNLPDCSWTDSAGKLFADTEVQSRSGWLRLDFRGALGTCSNGTSVHDKYVEFINNLDPGIQILGLLTREFFGGNAVEFADHAAAFACDAAFDRVAAWEILNEPDLDDAFGHLAFAEYLGRSSRKIHDCSANEKVVSGGVTARYPVSYLNDVSADLAANQDFGGWARLTDAVQGIGVHPYVDALTNLDTKENSRHAMLKAYLDAVQGAFPNEPFYITEFGWRAPDDDGVHQNDEVTDELQCANLIDAFAMLANRYNLVAATWFTLADFGDIHRNYGLSTMPPENRFRLAHQGYITGDCGGPTAGAYNPETDELQWQTTALARTGLAGAGLAAVSYEVKLAPQGSPVYTIFKTVTDSKVQLGAFYPPLAVGTYVWTVTKIVDGVRYPAADFWTLNFTGKPSPPAYANVGIVNGTSLRIFWSDTANNESGFEISTGFETRTAPANTSTFVWTGLTPGVKECFRVRAYNAFGASYWATEVCGTPPTPPLAPSNVTATVVTGTSVRVNWTDNSTDEADFEVSDGTTSVIVAPNSTSFVWTGIANGATKCFQVRSRNLGGNSAWGGSACATTPAIPAAPTGSSATIITGTSVKVSWTDNSATEYGFEISNGVTSNVVGANSTSFTWTGLAQGSYTCFRVRSYNLAGYSAWTPDVCVTTPTIPLNPNGQTAVALNGTSVKVSWVDRSPNEIGFEISNGVTSNVVGANTTTYTWTGLAQGTYMCFRIRAYNLAGYSAWTTPDACLTTPVIPAAPTGPAVLILSGTAVTFTWQDRSANETGFELFNGVSYVNVGPNTTAYTWTVGMGSYTCFSAKAFNLAGKSAATPYACATTPTIPAAPAGQAAVALNGTQVQITWQDRSTNETGFQIYNGVSYVNVGANVTSYIWTVAMGSYTCFSIKAGNLAGQSAATPYACVTTPTIPAAPTGQAAVAISTSQIRVTWQDRSGNETGFQIYDGVSYFTVPANTTTFVRSGLPSKKYMCFSIRSYNLAGQSSATPYACATTL